MITSKDPSLYTLYVNVYVPFEFVDTVIFLLSFSKHSTIFSLETMCPNSSVKLPVNVIFCPIIAFDIWFTVIFVFNFSTLNSVLFIQESYPIFSFPKYSTVTKTLFLSIEDEYVVNVATPFSLVIKLYFLSSIVSTTFYPTRPLPFVSVTLIMFVLFTFVLVASTFMFVYIFWIIINTVVLDTV